MLTFEPPFLVALAALIASVSQLVWAARRKP